MGKRKVRADTATASVVRDKLLYDPATGAFTWKWSSRKPGVVGQEAGWFDRSGHRVIEIEGNRYKASRLAWLYIHGEWPAEEIDHINRDPSDNRLCNLREATRVQNNVNRTRTRVRNLPRGVERNKKKFMARLRVGGITRHLGTFSTPEEAHEKYMDAARVVYGSYLPVEL